jgi:hypothetical protein
LNLKELNKNLFLYSVLFPFICIPTFNTDLQPLAGIFALLLLFGFTHNKFNSRQLVILLFIFLFLFSTIIFIIYETLILKNFNIKVFQFSKLISIFYGLLIFYIFQSKKINFNEKIINNTIYIYSVCTLSFIIFGEYYLYLQSFIVNQRMGDAFISSLQSYRGISILTPEPSVFSSILIFLLIMNEYFNSYKLDKKRYFFNILLIISMLFLSKSATGFLLLFAFLIYKILSKKKFILYFISITPIVILVISNYLNINIEGNRAASFFSTIFYNLDKINIYEILILDASSYKRFLDFTVSFFSLKSHIFGTGFSGFYQSLNEIALQNHYYLEYYNTDIGTGLVSPFSYGLMMFGLLFLLLILYVITLKKVNLFQKFYFLFHICFSISIGLPITWIILVYNKKQLI